MVAERGRARGSVAEEQGARHPFSESLGRRRLFGVFVCVSVGIRLGRLGDARGVRLLRPRVFARLEGGVALVPSVPQSAEEPRQGLRRRAVGVGPGEILRSRRRGVELAQLGAQLSEPGAGPGVGRIQRDGGHARSNRLREERPPLPRERGGSVGVHGRDRGVGRDGLIVRGDRVGELPALVKGVAALLRSLGHLPRLDSGAGDWLVYDTRRVHSTSRRWTCAGRRFQKRSFFADFHDERPTHALLLLVPPVENVSPAASVRAIGVRVELVAPHRRPARRRVRRRNLRERFRAPADHPRRIPRRRSRPRTRSLLPRRCSRWRGALWPNPCRTPSPPRPCCRTRPSWTSAAGAGPRAEGRRPAAAKGRGSWAHRLRRPQRGRLVRVHVPPVRLPRGLVLNLLPRVLERGGRRGLADGPPRSAEPSPSAGGHLSRVHDGGTRERLEGGGRVGWAEEPAADEEERTTGRHVLKTCGTRSVRRAPRSV